MYSNRKYSNGMFRDESKQQGEKSNSMFLRFQDLFKAEFKGISINFNQLTGDCTYTYEFSVREYIMTLNRKGVIIQEAIQVK